MATGLDDEVVDVWLIDDYGGMRPVGEVRLDRWPRDLSDGVLVPGVQLLTPTWTDAGKAEA